MSIWAIVAIGILFKLFLDSIKWACEWKIRQLEREREELYRKALEDGRIR